MRWRPIKTLRKEDIQDTPTDIILANSCNGPELFNWLDLHSAYRYSPDVAQAIKDEGVWSHWCILPKVPRV